MEIEFKILHRQGLYHYLADAMCLLPKLDRGPVGEEDYVDKDIPTYCIPV